MTITVKVRVNGNYRATVKQTIEGEEKPDITIVNPQEEKQLYFRHDKTNTFEITEEYLGEKT